MPVAFGFLAKNIITRIDGFNPYRVKKFEEDERSIRDYF